MGLPIGVQNVLSSSLAVGSAYIILFKAPFQRTVKVLFLLSSPILFMFSVVGRSYALLAFLLLLILAIHPERYRRRYLVYGVSLFLLINTHLYAAVIAGALLVADITTYKKGGWKDKHVGFVGSMFAAGTVLLFMTNYPGSFYTQYQQHYLHSTALSKSLISMSLFVQSVFALFYASLPGAYTLLLNVHRLLFTELAYMVPYAALLVLFVLGLVVLSSNSTTRKYGLAFYLTCLFGMVVLTMLTRNYNEHMGGMLVLVLWGSLWLVYPTERHKRSLILCGLTLVLLTNNYGLATYCLNHPFSGSKGAADYLLAENLDRSDTLMVSPNAEQGSAILPYLKTIRQIKTPEGFISFVDWRYWENQTSTTPQEIKQLVGNEVSNDNYRHILLVLPKEDQQTTVPNVLPYPLLYSGPKALNENLQIYKIK
jgi:hypothetical protein